MSTRELDMAMETKPRRLQRSMEHQEQTDFLPEADLIAQTVSPIGNTLTAGIHASRLNRIMASQPSQTGLSLLQLQRQYGNHYVQRVLALARKAGNESEVSPDVEDAIQQARGSGQPLDSGVRTQMESAFDADFGNVRVHADTEADVLNRAVSARAFTTGQDIFFSEGAYSPGSSSGQELIAHELTHVVQQNNGKVQTKLVVGAAHDEYEQEADEAAQEVMQQERQCARCQLGERPAGQQSAGEGLEDTLEAMAGEPQISVTQKAKSLTNCGSAEYKVQWSVQSGFFGSLSKIFGTKSGWIIQHVKFKADVADDKGSKKAANNSDGLEYWEAWEVDKAKVWVGFASGGAPHNADTFRTVDEGSKTKGTVSVTGKVQFIEGFNLKTPPWGYTVPAAGSLPTMTAAPAGWSDAAAKDHIMTVTWDCTGATETQTVTTTP